MAATSANMTRMRCIATQDLTLDPQLVTHAEAMFAVLSDPAIYQYENGPPTSVVWLRARYARLEKRRSADGQQRWLNWVVRLVHGPGCGELIGYVQATVSADASALIAYEFASAYWSRGLASQAVRAMIAELVLHYQTRELWAVLKRDNHRSMRLLERLGFALTANEQHFAHSAEMDEALMHRRVAQP